MVNLIAVSENIVDWAIPIADDVIGWIVGVLIGLVYFAFLCLATIFRKQWADNERLAFPLVRLPAEMIGNPGGFLFNRLMWVGFAIPMIVYTINGTTLTFQAGELLFLGASGGKTQGSGQWSITYRFAAQPNRTNIAIGDITVAAKKGWEYLWVRYQDMEDTAAKAVVKRPLAAYVEQVYQTGNFGLL